MSNTETGSAMLAAGPALARGAAVEVLTPRQVPLGGVRGMTVRRTLPQRPRSLVGAWCFLDHYGPDDVTDTGGMRVPPHPHTGLQTVSWLFSGEIEHRDSAGNHALVRPGELNLMTAGRGISHSEYSTARTTRLQGAQLWVALPEASRFVDPGFEHYRPESIEVPGGAIRVFLGLLAGSTSPVRTHSPLLGAELNLAAGSELALDVDPGYEHAVLVDTGSVILDGTAIAQHELGYRAPGLDRLTLRSGTGPTRLLLLGGPPFGEQILMWWNFVARTQEEVEAFRSAWQAEISGPGRTPTQFGLPIGDPDPALPAPPLPTTRLRPRH